MLRFLIEQGYQDRENQAVISEALGVIYDAKNENAKNITPSNNSENNNNRGDTKTKEEDEDTN